MGPSVLSVTQRAETEDNTFQRQRKCQPLISSLQRDTYQCQESNDEARGPSPVAMTVPCYPPVFCLNSHLFLLASLEMVSAHFLNLLLQAFG